MELCSKDHEEICFEGRTCPYCDMLENKIEELEDEIYNLKNSEEE